MTRLALDAGVDVLAHTPFTETLDAELVARAARAGQRWISTLDIHRDDPAARRHRSREPRGLRRRGRRRALRHRPRQRRPPVGVNSRELAALHAAGVRGAALIDALTDPWPGSADSTAVATFVPGDAPETLDDVPAWLGGATVVPAEELVHDDH